MASEELPHRQRACRNSEVRSHPSRDLGHHRVWLASVAAGPSFLPRPDRGWPDRSHPVAGLLRPILESGTTSQSHALTDAHQSAGSKNGDSRHRCLRDQSRDGKDGPRFGRAVHLSGRRYGRLFATLAGHAGETSVRSAFHPVVGSLTADEGAAPGIGGLVQGLVRSRLEMHDRWRGPARRRPYDVAGSIRDRGPDGMEGRGPLEGRSRSLLSGGCSLVYEPTRLAGRGS